MNTKPQTEINQFSIAAHSTVSPLLHALSNHSSWVRKSIESVTQPLTICSLFDTVVTKPMGWLPTSHKDNTQAAHWLISSATSQPWGRGQADTSSSTVSLQQITVSCELSTLCMTATMRSMSGLVKTMPPGCRLIGSVPISRWAMVEGCPVWAHSFLGKWKLILGDIF